ncbi:egg cell-secreted protein 1.1-like [Cornus florida]|uniref:egg cell-secreted protein 1.1-like n=1 Tax=Cornus florida TaxID=4283 RepID=UPI00289DB779|nr:egg cell-secreted protein 1.1-like [Cornus florida]
MGYSLKLIITVLAPCFIASMVMARPMNSKSTLMPRLKLDEEGSSWCWDSLYELQSCTGEVIQFFLNGETYLGPGCCHAIHTIQHQCWPNMLGSLGFTSEEGDILQGYCDATETNSNSNSTSIAPSPPPRTVNHTMPMSHN